jgi:hypothetical protein
MVESAAQDFLETGEWPTVEVMQRRMDRLRNGIEVQRALEEMPRFPGEVGGMYWTNVTVPIRMFKHIPGGRNLLPVCLSLVQLSMDVWLSDAEPPSISNTDPELRSIMPGRAPEVWLRAAQLLQASQPSPLAGGGYGPDGWSYIVNGSFVRRLSDILTIDDFFDAQQEVMEDAEAQRSGAAHEAIAAPTRHSVFVLMPFTETWSDQAFELFRQAATVMNLELAPTLYRSDDIEESDWITVQIVEAIEEADVILADITGANGNVMWELGYAQALKRPVVVVNQEIESSPFDVHAWRQVEYHLPGRNDEIATIARFLRVALGYRRSSTEE